MDFYDDDEQQAVDEQVSYHEEQQQPEQQFDTNFWNNVINSGDVSKYQDIFNAAYDLSNKPESESFLTQDQSQYLQGYTDTAPAQKYKSYWENPQVITRYKNALQSKAPGEPITSGVDPAWIDTVYNYMQYANSGETDPNKWKALPEGDPGLDMLRRIPPPPDEVMLPYEKGIYGKVEEPQAAQTTAPTQPVEQTPSFDMQGWNTLEPWQKTLMYIMFPGPSDDPNRPKAMTPFGEIDMPNMTSSVAQAFLAGLGGAAIGSAFGGVGAPIGFLLVGGATGYQAYTGNKIPVLNELMGLFNLPAEMLEKQVGLISQIKDSGLAEVLNHLGEAYSAGRMTYETQAGDWLNFISRTAKDINPEWSSGKQANTMQKWAISQGIAAPIATKHKSDKILTEIRNRLEAGETQEQIEMDVLNQYGDSAVLSDFVMQSILDPTFMAGRIGGTIGGKIAKVAKLPRMESAFKLMNGGNVFVDAVPFPLSAATTPLLRKAGLQPSLGALEAFQTYRGWIRSGYFPDPAKKIVYVEQNGIQVPKKVKVPISELPGIEKRIGGLKDDGTLKDLDPSDKQRLLDLKPETKAYGMHAEAMDLANSKLLELSDSPDMSDDGRVERAADIMRALGGQDIERVGEAGKEILYNPLAATVASAMGDFTNSEAFQGKVAEWGMLTDARKTIIDIAKVLNTDPSKIVEELSTNNSRIIDRINQASAINPDTPSARALMDLITTRQLDEQGLRDWMKIFTEEKKPVTYRQWAAELSLALADHLDDYYTKFYNIKPDPTWRRLSQLVKSVQSMVLLDMSPSFLVNNALNNFVTRLATGVWGVMTPKQANDWFARFGMKPEGLVNIETMSGQGGAFSRVPLAKMRKQLTGDGNLVRMNRKIQEFRSKFGLISKLSGKLETAESRSSYTIAAQNMWDRLWKKGNGFRPMDTATEQMLRQIDPDLPDAIYGMVASGLNMDEINNRIFRQAGILGNIDQIMDAAIDATPGLNNAPDIIRELIGQHSGIRNELRTLLENAKTPEDIDRAFGFVNDRLERFADERTQAHLINLANEVQQDPSLQNVGQLWLSMQDSTEMREMQQIHDWEDVFSIPDQAIRKHAIHEQFTRDEANWRRNNELELARMRGILGILGMDLQNQDGGAYRLIKSMMDRQQLWRDFYEGYYVKSDTAVRDPATGKVISGERVPQGANTVKVDGRKDILRKFFATRYDTPALSNAAWRDVQDTLGELYDRSTDMERQLQSGFNDHFVAALTEAHPNTTNIQANTRAWRDRTLMLQTELRNAMIRHRNMMKTVTDPQQRRQAWTEFNIERRNMIAQWRNEERTFWNDVNVDRPPQTTPPTQAPVSDVERAAAADQPLTPDDIASTHADATDIANEADTRQTEAETAQSRRMTKREFFSRMEDILTREARENPDRYRGIVVAEQVKATEILMDMIAEKWGMDNNRNPDEWWTEHIRDILDGGDGLNQAGLFQMGRVDTPEFKQWFGDSKVVDEQGEPVVVFHGTQSEFTEFNDISFFAENKDYANEISSGKWWDKNWSNDKGLVMPVYLKMENPLTVAMSSKDFSVPSKEYPIINKAKSENYDGVIFVDETSNEKYYVTFDKSQIKSLFNQGTFDPNNPNILYQLSHEVARLAHQHGIPTADKNGKPINAHLLNVVKKYGGAEAQQYTKIDDVPYEVVERALEKRLRESGVDPTRNVVNDRILRERVFGSTKFDEDGLAIIKAFKGANISTFVHELSHVFFRDLPDADMTAVIQLAGEQGLDATGLRALHQKFDAGEATTEEHAQIAKINEHFARGWERYLADPKDASIPAAQRNLFQRFTEWITEIYTRLSGRNTIAGSDIDIDIKATVNIGGRDVSLKSIFDDMLFDQSKMDNPDGRSLLQSRPVGNDTTAFGVQNPSARYPMRFRLVELNDPVMSLDMNFNDNPDFPQNLQARDRGRAASKVQANQIRGQFDPLAMIEDTKQIDRGTPIIDSGLHVISGNGRTWAIRMLDQTEPARYTQYKDLLGQNIANYGITPEEFATFEKPYLVREYMGDPATLEQFAAESNQGSGLGMSSTEKATVLSAKLDKNAIAKLNTSPDDNYDSALIRADNEDLKNSFIRGMPANDRASYADSTGMMNMDGVNLLKHSLFLWTFGEDLGGKLLEKFTRIDKPEMARISSQITNALPSLAKLKANIDLGYIKPDFDIALDVATVFEKLAEKKQEGVPISQYLASLGGMDLFGLAEGGLNDFQKQLITFMDENPLMIRQTIENYVSEALKQRNQETLLQIAEPTTKNDLFGKAIEEIGAQKEAERIQRNPKEFASQVTNQVMDTPYVIDGIAKPVIIQVTDANGNVVALVPALDANNEPFRQSIIRTRKGLIKVLGYDPQNTKALVYETQDGRIVKTSEAISGKVLYQTGDDYDDLPIYRQEKQSTELEQRGRRTPPIGRVPPGDVPVSLDEGQVMREAMDEHVKPLLERARQMYHQQSTSGRQMRFDNIPTDAQSRVKQYLGDVSLDMQDTKLATMRYAELMREKSMLNYSKRYGVDDIADVFFPYQFWFTRTFANWAQRMVDRPQWYGMYARIKQMQDRLERQGVPTRLKNKMAIPLPWGGWMGGVGFIDPMSQAFPFTNFTKPFDFIDQEQNRTQKQAMSLLQDWVKSGKITGAQETEAKTTMQGAIWDQAYSQASEEGSNLNDPYNYVSTLMKPAMPFDIGYKLASGQSKNIEPTPLYRTGKAYKQALKGTPVSIIGDLIGLVSKPEEALRTAAGLQEYGKLTDYYIDRQLANMAADGAITADESMKAMIERTGNAYEQALSRVRDEMSLKTPGTQPIYAAKQGGSPQQIIAATMASVFPLTLFPEGELKLRGLYDDYQKAWEDSKAGNKNAVTEFFDKHPEYRARQLMYSWDDPEGRLRKFLIDNIWQKYYEVGEDNAYLAKEQLGKQFADSFLNKTTRSYDSIDVKTLAKWAQSLNMILPQVKQIEGVQGDKLDLWPSQMQEKIKQYKQTRDLRWPEIGKKMDYYRRLPSTWKQTFLQKNPDLAQYFKWNEAYARVNPDVAPYLNGSKVNAAAQNPNAELSNWQNPVTRPLTDAYYQERDQRFPGVAALEERYMELDPAGRRQFMTTFPLLRQYFDWKKKYRKDNPQLDAVMTNKAMDYAEPNPAVRYGKQKAILPLSQQELALFSPTLLQQIMLSVYGGNKLGPGSLMALTEIWENMGKPYGDVAEFYKRSVMPTFKAKTQNQPIQYMGGGK